MVTEAAGSAMRWGPLWGARAQDWAAIEEQQAPTYEEALRHVRVTAGTGVLDVGCGSGAFLRLVADRRGQAYGIDASEALVAVAHTLVPEADVRVGEMEALPFADDTFDVVTGFNAFFFANDMVAALREARRVAKPAAPVVIQVWGAHDRCSLTAMKEIARPFFPPRPPDAPPDPDLSVPGALEALAAEAGLVPVESFTTTWAYEYPDDASLTQSLVSPAGLAASVGPEREDEVKAAIVAGLAPYRTTAGGYRLENELLFLIARA